MRIRRLSAERSAHSRASSERSDHSRSLSSLDSSASSSAAPFFKFLKRLSGIGLMGVFGYFVYRTLSNRLSQSSSAALAPEMSALITGLVGFTLWLVLFHFSWEWIFRKICSPGSNIVWTQTGFAFFRSLLARYIPGGKMWYLAARTESLSRLGVPRSDAARSVLYEQIHYTGATAIGAALLLPFFLTLTPVEQLHLPALLIGLGVALVGVALWLFWPDQLFDRVNRTFSKLFPKRRVQPLILKGHLHHWRAAFGLFFLLMVCQGVILYPIVRSVIPPTVNLSLSKWALVLGAYPIARLAGQLSVLSPGGIGVREGAYLLMALPILGSDVTSVVVIWARVLSVVSEVAIFLVFGVLSVLTRYGRMRVHRDKTIR